MQFSFAECFQRFPSIFNTQPKEVRQPYCFEYRQKFYTTEFAKHTFIFYLN